MLWYKSWLETRWRFLIGFALLAIGACGVVLAYPRVMQLMPLVPASTGGGEIGRRIREAADLMRDYRGYVWAQWFAQNMIQTWTLFAVLLGTGGLLSQTSGGAAIYTLSLPVSRGQILGTRAAIGLAELFAMAIVPSLLIPAMSPAVAEHYSVASAVVHATCLFVAGSAFFSLAFFLSTVFADVWRPLLIACAIAMGVALAEQLVRGLSSYSIFGVMRAESYFRDGRVPWLGLAAAAAASTALLYASIVNIARRDF